MTNSTIPASTTNNNINSTGSTTATTTTTTSATAHGPSACIIGTSGASRVFQILYRNEEVSLRDVIMFRAHLLGELYIKIVLTLKRIKLYKKKKITNFYLKTYRKKNEY